MNDLNHVVLIGNLTKDPDLRHTGGGTAVCELRVASNSSRKDSSGEWVDKPNYFGVTVFGNQAETCAQYLEKGQKVAVDGRLDWQEWEAQDGTKRSKVEIIASTVHFLTKAGGGNRDGDSERYDSADYGPQAPAVPEDDIPF